MPRDWLRRCHWSIHRRRCAPVSSAWQRPRVTARRWRRVRHAAPSRSCPRPRRSSRLRSGSMRCRSSSAFGFSKTNCARHRRARRSRSSSSCSIASRQIGYSRRGRFLRRPISGASTSPVKRPRPARPVARSGVRLRAWSSPSTICRRRLPIGSTSSGSSRLVARRSAPHCWTCSLTAGPSRSVPRAAPRGSAPSPSRSSPPEVCRPPPAT